MAGAVGRPVVVVVMVMVVVITMVVVMVAAADIRVAVTRVVEAARVTARVAAAEVVPVSHRGLLGERLATGAELRPSRRSFLLLALPCRSCTSKKKTRKEPVLRPDANAARPKGRGVFLVGVERG